MEDITCKTRINHHLQRESEEIFNSKFQVKVAIIIFSIYRVYVYRFYTALNEHSPSDAGTSGEKSIVINEHRTGTR